jgi:hypothetical protein
MPGSQATHDDTLVLPYDEEKLPTSQGKQSDSDVMPAALTYVPGSQNEHNVKPSRYEYVPASMKLQAKLEPVYETCEGWKESTAGARSYKDLPAIQVAQIEHFFAHYKDLEPGKWTKLKGWQDADVAKKMIMEGVERANAAGFGYQGS